MTTDRPDVAREWALAYLELDESWHQTGTRAAAEFIIEQTKPELPEHMLGMKVHHPEYGEGIAIYDHPGYSDFIEVAFKTNKHKIGVDIVPLHPCELQWVDYDPKNPAASEDEC